MMSTLTLCFASSENRRNAMPGWSETPVAENRAKSVYDFLVKCGVNPKQLTYEGKGNAANVYENNQKANRAVIIK